MAAITKEEVNLIQEIRGRVKDIVPEEDLYDDYFIVRWLRARDLNLDKATAMLQNAMKWRKENNVSEILNKKLDPYFSETYLRWIDGTDKQRRPVYCAAIGEWDLRDVVQKGLQKGFQEYTTEGFELLLKNIKQENERRGPVPADSPPITQMIAIFDFEGFAWSQLLNYRAVAEFLTLGSIYEAYYPETLHSAYFINSPSLISKIFLLLKPILAPKTMAKIRCFGTDKEEWRTELLKIIDADQLVPRFGGNKGLTSSQGQDQEQ